MAQRLDNLKQGVLSVFCPSQNSGYRVLGLQPLPIDDLARDLGEEADDRLDLSSRAQHRRGPHPKPADFASSDDSQAHQGLGWVLAQHRSAAGKVLGREKLA